MFDYGEVPINSGSQWIGTLVAPKNSRVISENSELSVNRERNNIIDVYQEQQRSKDRRVVDRSQRLVQVERPDVPGAYSCLGNTREDFVKECDLDHQLTNTQPPIIEITLYGWAFPALVDTGNMISVWGDSWAGFTQLFLCFRVRVCQNKWHFSHKS